MADNDKKVPDQVTLEKTVVQGVLTELTHTKFAKSVGQAADVKFFHDGEFRAYADIKKPDGGALAVTDDDIKKISITLPDGSEKYFERIARVDQTNDEKVGEPNTGFKAVAWLETDKDGKPRLAENGRPQVQLGFPGYDGDPVENKQDTSKMAFAARLAFGAAETGLKTSVAGGTLKSFPLEGRIISPQTASMFDVGSAKLYPPAANVNEFMQQVTKELETRGVENAEYKVCGYSMGCAPAMAGAALKDAPLFNIEPVAAPLFLKTSEAAFAKNKDELTPQEAAFIKSVEASGLTPKAFMEKLQATAAGSDSMRIYREDRLDANGKPLSSLSGRLQTESDPAKQDAARAKNMVHSAGEVMRELAKKLGNDPKALPLTEQTEVDPNNDMVGNRIEYVVPTVENIGTTNGAKFDPAHALVNVIKIANDQLKENQRLLEMKKEKVEEKAPEEKTQEGAAAPIPEKTEPVLTEAQKASNVIAAIHDEVKSFDVNKDKGYDDAERTNIQNKLEDFESKRAAWYESHTKVAQAAIEAAANGQKFEVSHMGGDFNGDGMVSGTEAARLADVMELKTDSEKKDFANKLLEATGSKDYKPAEATDVQRQQTQAQPVETPVKGAER